jgi:signal transduction histidine kinase
MPLSRLRLRLTAWFGGAFLLGLGLLHGALYLYFEHQGTQRLTRELSALASEMPAAIERERYDPPGRPLADAVEDAVQEWPAGPEAVAVYDPTGHAVAVQGPPGLLGPDLSPAILGTRAWTAAGVDRHELRATAMRDPLHPELTIVTARSTATLRAEQEVLLGWLLASAPLVLLLSLVAGYLLARRALQPVSIMSREIADLGPEALDRRLPVNRPADELDLLADRFNGLLDRLDQARKVNRRFLAQVAHQLKTPLTVVRGESELGLERSRTREEHVRILERIRLASAQMDHRVNELLLLAQAELGERPPLLDPIELDGLALETADLMRGRASATQHALELRRVEPVELKGHELLLREATIELLENACRHASPGTTIALSAYPAGSEAHISVASAGSPVSPEVVSSHGEENDQRRGLGLSIVRWIAGIHGGQMEYRRVDDTNLFTLVLPLAS